MCILLQMNYSIPCLVVGEKTTFVFSSYDDLNKHIFYTYSVWLSLSDLPYKFEINSIDYICEIDTNTQIHNIYYYETDELVIKIPKMAVQIVIRQTNCSLHLAIIALVKNNGSFLNAIHFINNQ
jgi:hypothetical protein